MLSRNRPSTPLDFGASFSLRGITIHPPTTSSLPPTPALSPERGPTPLDKHELGPDDTALFPFDDEDCASSNSSCPASIEVDLASLAHIPSLESLTTPRAENTMMGTDIMAGPSYKPRPFSPTPHPHDESPTSSPFSRHDEAVESGTTGVQQRHRRGRRPLSAYPGDVHVPHIPTRKFTDPTPHTSHYEEELSYDSRIDLYPHEFDDEGRAPTLSFVTTSTTESTASTPSLSASYGGYRHDPLDGCKPDFEPRIRMRTGRSTAYSSAESSRASGVYSAYGEHPYSDAPPLPVVPQAYASSPKAPLSPSQSFHQPWQSNLTRERSNSSSTTSSHVENYDIEYQFDQYELGMRWEEECEPQAVRMVDEGKESILDRARLAAMGGVENLNAESISSLRGITHMLLPSLGSCLIENLSELLTVLAPTLLVLDLGDNDLCFLPEALRSCTQLEELNIAGNPVRKLPGWVGELVALRVLVVDGCALTALPAEMSRLCNLHTLCARRNRLINLPPWLCLLSKLETLRVDDNPFAPEWQPIVAPITANHVLPARTASQRSNFSRLREAASTHSIASSASQSLASEGGDLNSVASATQSIYQLALGSIAEDQPHTAPLADTKHDDLEPPHPSFAGSLRRMRSAGSLLNIKALASPPPSATPSDGHERRMSSTAGSDDAEPTSAPRSGKWGFLRKMSMNRLREKKDGGQQLSASASANIKLMPPPLPHSKTSVGAPPRASLRPALLGAYSATTVPVRDAPISEFGSQPSQPLAAASLPMSKRARRRSFLPIDPSPPSLNVAIPSTSPFMPPVQIFDAPDALVVDSPAEMTLSADDPRYAQGLESIKSYLRDLYDLSQPVIEPYGGFEVMDHAAELPGSPASGTQSATISQRRRRPTLDSSSRCVSTTSVDESHFDHSFSQEEAEEALDGKKFKNDKVKRARVLREIYETERTYVRALGELVQIYVRPAQQPIKTGSAESVVPLSERKVVFGGIESILSIHKENLLPALEKAVRPLLDGDNDDDGSLSASTAHAVGSVFRTYIAYMKQYSTYINNFDNALSRMKAWSAVPTPLGGASLAALSVGATSVGMSPGLSDVHSGSILNASQKKRVKTFLKRAKEHPLHSQINLESYLLLPVQRVPRYKLLLEDLAMCTPPQEDGPRDTLDDALNEIAGLASLMNEEKRDAESRLRLFYWQKRITMRGPSPLVQPHRKLILDGPLTLIRLVKKAAAYVEVDSMMLKDGDATVTSSRTVIPVEYIRPEPMDRNMMLVLCSDLLVLVQPRADAPGGDGAMDLCNVLRMSTLREPASVVNGCVLRVVDNKSIYYFSASGPEDVLQWCRAINTARRK